MPIESQKEWIKVAGCAAAAAIYVGALIALAGWLPGCDGVRTITMGGSMLLAGCPERLP
jgi:hypothetical protein